MDWLALTVIQVTYLATNVKRQLVLYLQLDLVVWVVTGDQIFHVLRKLQRLLLFFNLWFDQGVVDKGWRLMKVLVSEPELHMVSWSDDVFRWVYSE